MSRRVAILNARVIDPATGRDEPGGVIWSDGFIEAAGSAVTADQLGAEVEVQDAEGHILAPGLVDLRVRTGEPGAEHKETLASATRSAAAGGVTSLVITPDTGPVIDDAALVDFVFRRARDSGTGVKVYPAAAATVGLKGDTIAELGLLQAAGAVMASQADRPITSAQVMRRVLSYARAFDLPLSHRAADPSLTQAAVAHDGEYALKLGLRGAPAVGELITAQRDIALAEAVGGRLLIDLVSSRLTPPVIKAAKAKGVHLAASVSAAHLCLNILDIGDYRTYAKLSPPLREEADRQALLGAVNGGVIDIVVSAHDPQPPEDKRLPFAEAAFGAVGLETLLSAVLGRVAEGELALMAGLRALTAAPADWLGLPQGRLSRGAPADLVLIDAEAPWVCRRRDLRSKSKNTPFDDRRMTGRVLKTIVDGRTVFDRAAEARL